MSEVHDTGLTKQERYAIKKHQINQDFDKKLANKSFFTSKQSIEDDRESALKALDHSFYGGNGRGGFRE